MILLDFVIVMANVLIPFRVKIGFFYLFFDLLTTAIIISNLITMAIHIVVDGYNLIGSERGLQGNLEAMRNRLIQQLRRYQESRGYPVTVVFDGWRSGWVHEVEERSGGLRIIFSQQGEKADSVIQRLARQMGSGCVVVTSDREVRRAVEASGAVAIYAGEFGAKLKHVERESFLDEEEGEEMRESRKRGNPRRLSKSERKRRDRLKKL